MATTTKYATRWRKILNILKWLWIRLWSLVTFHAVVLMITICLICFFGIMVAFTLFTYIEIPINVYQVISFLYLLFYIFAFGFVLSKPRKWLKFFNEQIREKS